MMKIAIISDAWHPQVNGVVRALSNTIYEIKKMGHQVKVIHPDMFWNFKFPLYPEIKVCLPGFYEIKDAIGDVDAIHIAVEGPLGLRANNYLSSKNIPFTTSYTTRWPEYFWKNFWFPKVFLYKYLRWFHKRSSCTMVSTKTMKNILENYGFHKNIKYWTRGIDRKLFRYKEKVILDEQPRVYDLLYVGRVSKEKNIKDFLKVKFNTIKVKKTVVGDGPARSNFEKMYPDVNFLGYLHGEDLVNTYQNADVFVFPSKTDTFGNVILEALSCGTPVAAYPVPGPKDIITKPAFGCLHEDLSIAILNAIEKGNPESCAAYAGQYTWRKSAALFVKNLRLITK